MSRYAKKSGQFVEEAMHEYKRVELKSGKKGGRVKSRRQAVAIGVSKARQHGLKVFQKNNSSRALVSE